MQREEWMIYGATGYSGRLVAQEALERGHHPIVAGRSLSKTVGLGNQLGLTARPFALDTVDTIVRNISGLRLVFNAAGPFSATALPMMRACVAAKVNYLDITGEIPVFERSHTFDRHAREGGIAIIPGVGFDVVPTDCLAAFVAGRVRNPQRLDLGFRGIGGISPGTLKTSLRNLPHGIYVRRAGRLVRIRPGSGSRRVSFPDKVSTMVPVSWGDLSTAYHTTRIPNITTYTELPAALTRLLSIVFLAGGPLLSSHRIRSVCEGIIDKRVKGPDTETRAKGRAYVWARVEGEDGSFSEAWLRTLEAYRFTAVAGVRSVERVLENQPRGALTPSQAFGKDFVLEIPGTRRADTPDVLASVDPNLAPGP